MCIRDRQDLVKEPKLRAAVGQQLHDAVEGAGVLGRAAGGRDQQRRPAGEGLAAQLVERARACLLYTSIQSLAPERARRNGTAFICDSIPPKFQCQQVVFHHTLHGIFSHCIICHVFWKRPVMLFAVFFAYSSYYWWRAFPYNEFGGMRMTNYSVLRNAVPLDEAAERYGTVRRGFMLCPFHADRVPSLRCV